MANTKVPIELSSTPGIVDNSTATAITIDSAGAATFSAGITTTGINVTGTASMDGLIVNTGSYGAVGAGSGRMYGSTTHGLVIQGNGTTNDFLFLGSDGSELLSIADNGNLGVGVTPSAWSTAYDAIQVAAGGALWGNASTASVYVSSNIYFDGAAYKALTTAASALYLQSGGQHIWYNAASVTAGATATAVSRMTLDASGNLLVGKTTNDGTTAGHRFTASGFASHVVANDYPLLLNRLSSNGALLTLRKDSVDVGSIFVNAGNRLTIFGTNGSVSGVGLYYGDSVLLPTNYAGTLTDNVTDLGQTAYRFDNIYATNGTIQTSDKNEKQDIEALSDAETAVAVTCKGLLRKFRWIDSVEEKGADARIHFGIIAQDLQAAFAAEGLDAGRYAMFISSTWWETQTEVEAVEAVEFVQAVEAVYDEDGELVSDAVEGVEAVEAKDAYTRTDTFATLEEAPEGATERTRLGVRYPELLAFIIAAI